MSQQFIYTLFSAKASAIGTDLWYVGRTTDILTRFSRHQSGTGAKCLQGRSNVVLTKLEKETPFLELVRTLELMKEHGPENVRGGPFCNRVHSVQDLEVIKTLLESDSFGRNDPKVETKTDFRMEADVNLSSTMKSSTMLPSSTDSSETESEGPPAKKSKIGSKWTPEDLDSLESYINGKKYQSDMPNKSVSYIAQTLGRTVGSVESRARTLIMNRIQNSSFAAAAKHYNRSEKELREFLSCERSIFEP